MQATGGQRELSEAELSLNRYHELFEKYEKRFEGNEFGIPAYVLANFYAGWELECGQRQASLESDLAQNKARNDAAEAESQASDAATKARRADRTPTMVEQILGEKPKLIVGILCR
jgi:hypothetical protein